MGKHRHFKPENFSDRMALIMVKALGVPRAWLFGKNHTRHLLVLETIAAVPGMIAGALIHFSCLRRIKDDRGWIEMLIKEADTERKHLLTFREIVEPSCFDRVLIWVGQVIFVMLYFIMYIVAPKACHRFVGYLEEDAVEGYEVYIAHLKEHPEENTQAPKIAYRFWDLPKDTRLVDLMYVIMGEEMKHRDVNHDFANQLQK